jgi:predicted kinase/GNAT superfamily N-acetyltransferase
MEYTIRPMIMGDYDTVIELWRKTDGIVLSDTDQREPMNRFLRRNPGLSMVAQRGGMVIGAVLGSHDGRRGYLHHLVVRSGLRGLGIGSALVQESLGALADASIVKCNVFIVEGNAAVVAFWEHNGFRLLPHFGWMQRSLEQAGCAQEDLTGVVAPDIGGAHVDNGAELSAPSHSHVLALFSGLPGTGKTALARQVSRELGIPLFAKDRVQSVLRIRGLTERESVDGYHLLFDLADEQLALGLSVLLDAVFPMEEFRLRARDIARRHGGRFRAIHCVCSDVKIWRQRVEGRRQVVPHWTPVVWSEVERIQATYEPWEAGAALSVDSANPMEENLATVLEWLSP